jgi:DNA polymerase III delta subunit
VNGGGGMPEERLSHIMNQIKMLEFKVEELYEQMYNEDDWEKVCALFDQVNLYAAKILHHNIELRTNKLYERWDQLALVVYYS